MNKIKVEWDTSTMYRTSSRNVIDLSLIGFIFTKLDNFLSQLIRIQQFVDCGFESWNLEQVLLSISLDKVYKCILWTNVTDFEIFNFKTSQ